MMKPRARYQKAAVVVDTSMGLDKNMTIKPKRAVFDAFDRLTKQQKTSKNALAIRLIERAVTNPQALAAFLGEQA